MVEVFKTNVTDRHQGNFLITKIHSAFKGYTANFDLEDCDKILRVECRTGEVNAMHLISLLKEYGVEAEVLPDELIEEARFFFTEDNY